MFTPHDRSALRDALIASARADGRIPSVALTGSGALGAEDEWSDIDLAFAVAPGVELQGVIADWTDRMYGEHGAVHHMDILAGPAVFRVFLLRNTLQVDLAFWPASEFGAIGPTFRLVFGTAAERPVPGEASARDLIDMGWLYALHARSSIARRRVWQAEYMVSGARDHVLALACLRMGVPTVQGRGMDKLPVEVSASLAGALVRSLELDELRRAFGVACRGLIGEIELADAKLALKLAPTIRELASVCETSTNNLPPSSGATT